MRVIVNLHSNHLANTAGWRARAIQINSKNQSNLKKVLKAITFENGSSIFDIIIEKNRLKDEFILYVNGSRIPDDPDFKTQIKDNVQLHLIDKPGKNN